MNLEHYSKVSETLSAFIITERLFWFLIGRTQVRTSERIPSTLVQVFVDFLSPSRNTYGWYVEWASSASFTNLSYSTLRSEDSLNGKTVLLVTANLSLLLIKHLAMSSRGRTTEITRFIPRSLFLLLGAVAYPGILFGGRVQQIQLRTERTGIWGQLPPSQGFWRQL